MRKANTDPQTARARNAERQRAWRRKNPEKYMQIRLRNAQKTLDRLRENQAITEKKQHSGTGRGGLING